MTATSVSLTIPIAKDLLTGAEYGPAETRDLLQRTADIKARPSRYASVLRNKHIALIFEKPSLRTRVTFEVGIQSMGGFVVFLDHTQARLGVHIRIATPANYAPDPDVLADAKRVIKETRGKIELFTDPQEAVSGCQAVYTDSWTSMGFEAEEKVRRQVFKPYQVNRKLMEQAAPGAVFMHCLPAHRGAEVTDEVLDAPYSVVLQQSENRMYVQKAILHTLYT